MSAEYGLDAGMSGGVQGSVMGVGGGIHDDAVDVTYSTKPDGGNNFRMATTKKIS